MYSKPLPDPQLRNQYGTSTALSVTGSQFILFSIKSVVKNNHWFKFGADKLNLKLTNKFRVDKLNLELTIKFRADVKFRVDRLNLEPTIKFRAGKLFGREKTAFIKLSALPSQLYSVNILVSIHQPHSQLEFLSSVEHNAYLLALYSD